MLNNLSNALIVCDIYEIYILVVKGYIASAFLCEELYLTKVQLGQGTPSTLRSFHLDGCPGYLKSHLIRFYPSRYVDPKKINLCILC